MCEVAERRGAFLVTEGSELHIRLLSAVDEGIQKLQSY